MTFKNNKCIICQSYNQWAPKVGEIQACITRGMGPRKLSTDAVRGVVDRRAAEPNSTEQRKRRDENRSAMGSVPSGVFPNRKRSQSGLYIP